jgi:hypothetical protein
MAALALPAAVLLAVLAAPAPPATDTAAATRRFILGAPDRFALAGDRQHPRRYERVESAVAAYADVDEVVDPTWLRHEVEGYARRAADCDRQAPVPCRRAVRRLGDAWVVQLVTGAHAEVVWPAGRRAVRLGWRRVVSTPTGTMTLDDPPAEFAAALLAELPSDLHPARDGDVGEAWADAEIDRRLYYVGRALDAVTADGAEPSAASLHFARAGLRAVEAADGIRAGGDAAGEVDGVAALLAVRARWAAAVARRAVARQPPFRSVEPWCAAPTLGDAPPSLARLP